MGLFDWLKSPKKSSTKVKLENWMVQAIRLQTKNLAENVEIVNTSSDYDSAVAAFDAACTALRFLSDFTDEEIRAAGCSLNKSPAPYLSYLLENREELLENVRSRSHSFSSGHQSECTPARVRSQEYDYRKTSPSYDFLSKSAGSMEVYGDSEKIHQLELQLPDFPSFVRSCFDSDGELPPCIYVRDSLPRLYAKFGEWEKAASVVRLCISCGAYGCTKYRNSRDHKGHWVAEPEVGESELLFL